MHPEVRVIRMADNHGSCAKNFALPLARGRYVVFLDDDSYPEPGSIRQMIRHFEARPMLGAASFTVTLPDGSRECSAFPDVFIGCGVGLRRRALQDTGPLPGDFFMQAEEYDLSLRLLDAGWEVDTFDDLHVAHEKTAAGRKSGRTTRLDVRNNFVLAMRYFPAPWSRRIALDWTRRYWLIAKSNNHRVAFALGLSQGVLRSLVGYPIRRPVNERVFEQFAKIRLIENRLRQARDEFGLRRVVFADCGKNIYAYWLAAKRCSIEVNAIADNQLAKKRFWHSTTSYRGIPVVSDADAIFEEYDAIIVSNLSPVHAAKRKLDWKKLDGDVPVIDLMHPQTALAPIQPLSLSAPLKTGSRKTISFVANSLAKAS
jgi:GT2 family glycosyltransferase